MTPLLDEAPYPFQRPDAQELLVKLMRLYASTAEAVAIAEDSGVDISHIDTGHGFFFVWRAILKRTAADGSLRTLVERVYERLAPTSPMRAFFKELLNNQPITLTEGPHTSEGAPLFIEQDDQVMQPETLLYHDELMMQVGRVPQLIKTLQRLLELSPSVCRLSVSTPAGSQLGTGFRIAPNQLLTNWHVVHSPAGLAATSISAEFGYEDTPTGAPNTPTVFTGILTPVAASQPNDWAIIELIGTLPDTIPIISLNQAAIPVVEQAAYIIQHPNGERKRLAYVRNQISFVDDRVLHYLTDTQGGSSGAPVFNADGQLIGLHHAGGRPQAVAGKAPLSKNEGIRIGQILKEINLL